METYLKRRILGAVITVIVLAIAMPVVLDSTRQLDLLETDVPPMPTIPDWAYEVDYDQARQDGEELINGQAEAALVVPDPKVVSQDTPAAENIAADKAGSDIANVPYAWTVQIGAFGDAANAQKLVDDLRKQGYKAYSDTFPHEKLIRVYVGPEVKRENAEKNQAKLKALLKQDDIHIKRWLPGQ